MSKIEFTRTELEKMLVFLLLDDENWELAPKWISDKFRFNKFLTPCCKYCSYNWGKEGCVVFLDYNEVQDAIKIAPDMICNKFHNPFLRTPKNAPEKPGPGLIIMCNDCSNILEKYIYRWRLKNPELPGNGNLISVKWCPNCKKVKGRFPLNRR